MKRQVLMAVLVLGCGATDKGVGDVADTTSAKALLEAVNNAEGVEPKTRIKARHCAHQAYEYAESADTNDDWDTFLLVAAGVAGGGGAVTSAVAGVVDAGDRKDRLEVLGIAGIASASAILALRVALDLNSVATAERTAAAKNQRAAILLLDAAADANPFEDCIGEAIVVADARRRDTGALAQFSSALKGAEERLALRQKSLAEQIMLVERLKGDPAKAEALAAANKQAKIAEVSVADAEAVVRTLEAAVKAEAARLAKENTLSAP